MPDRPDNPKNDFNEIKMITLDELTNSFKNYNRVQELEERIKKLEAVGEKMCLLMFNGTMAEMRQTKWEWRELVPKKEDTK